MPDHILPSRLMSQPVKVLVAGCGGTGSALACGLPYLHQALLAHGHPGGLQVTLADGDLISETNCVRQPFSISEVGLYKATVLSTRINLFWGLNWKAINEYMDEQWTGVFDVVISCVDTRKARRRIAKSSTLKNARYWLDCGNNAATGQFVLGEPQTSKTNHLPTVDELYPEILNVKLDGKDKLPSCSAVEALAQQEPFINQLIAQHALAMLARLFRYGRLSYHGGFINIETGKCAAIPVKG